MLFLLLLYTFLILYFFFVALFWFNYIVLFFLLFDTTFALMDFLEIFLSHFLQCDQRKAKRQIKFEYE